MSDQPREGWVLFDGACGICSRLAHASAPTLRRLGLETAPLQSEWVPQLTGLPPEQLLSDIRLLRHDGSLTSGADVYRYVMRRIWWMFPIYLLSKTPVVRQLFDWGYRSFARHRLEISSSCGLPR
jgi:predicted DCC family thiol-disulfide oxidoreductase YuxK